ncbi:MAG: histidinol-phosphatase [Clostridia bacterium]|nr:histidinol-phosphatase [Clostridia bacterium]
MREKFNLHTHSVYCDGRDTPEEMVKAAIEKGFSAIGFSGHKNSFDPEVSMSHESARVYRRKIGELKEKYKKSIRVLLGVEQDIFEPEPATGYEYIIGSVHYIKHNGKYLSIDQSRENFDLILKEIGDTDTLIKNYFELVGDTLKYTPADIIGHFDIIAKFNEGGVYFDEEDPGYIKAAVSAMEKICHIPFEVNTGAISRGYKKAPYPSLTLLKKLRDMGGRVVYSSDCHAKEDLECAYDDAIEYIRAAGFERFLSLDEVKQWK